MQLSPAQHLVARPETREWMRRAAKLGYAVKGVVYGVTGALVLQAALGLGGQIADERDAVERIGRSPFGSVGLILVGVGLLCYALWRIVEATADVYHRGSSAKGVAIRAGVAITGLFSGAMGVTALQLASGSGQGSSGSKSWIFSLSESTAGLVALFVIGAAVAGAGVYRIYSGFSDKFEKHLEVSRLSPQRRKWVKWSGRIGCVAHGVVFGLIGVALVRTALMADPEQAAGFKGALAELSRQPYGGTLLALVAAGLLAYAVHLLTTAQYRKLV